MKKISAMIVLAASLTACATPPRYMQPMPTKTLALEQALAGTTYGEGSVTTLTGDVTEFKVVIKGSWDGKVLTLVEDFAYTDGTKDRKTWHLTKVSEGVFSGTREDVIGTAHVFQDGKGVRLDYHVHLPTGLGQMKVRFRDLLYLDEAGAISNQAVVSKLGLRVARVEIIMRPETAQK